LKGFTDTNTKGPRDKLREVNERKVEGLDNIEDVREKREKTNQILKRNNEEKKAILKEIKQKSISLESFWRCLFYKM